MKGMKLGPIKTESMPLAEFTGILRHVGAGVKSPGPYQREPQLLLSLGFFHGLEEFQQVYDQVKLAEDQLVEVKIALQISRQEIIERGGS